MVKPVDQDLVKQPWQQNNKAILNHPQRSGEIRESTVLLTCSKEETGRR